MCSKLKPPILKSVRYVKELTITYCDCVLYGVQRATFQEVNPDGTIKSLEMVIKKPKPAEQN